MNNKYLLDSLASISFWTPLYFVFGALVLHLDYWQLLLGTIFSIIINFSCGGLFGKYLDVIRAKLKRDKK